MVYERGASTLLIPLRHQCQHNGDGILCVGAPTYSMLLQSEAADSSHVYMANFFLLTSQ